MNSKGQSSSIFIIIIPIIIVALAFIYDNAMMVVTTNRYKSVTKDIIKEVLVNSYDDKETIVKDLFEKNKYETEQLSVEYDGTNLKVYNIHSYPSIFGIVFGVKKYRAEVYLSGHLENNEVVIEEVEED